MRARSSFLVRGLCADPVFSIPFCLFTVYNGGRGDSERALRARARPAQARGLHVHDRDGRADRAVRPALLRCADAAANGARLAGGNRARIRRVSVRGMRPGDKHDGIPRAFFFILQVSTFAHWSSERLRFFFTGSVRT